MFACGLGIRSTFGSSDFEGSVVLIDGVVERS